MVDAVFFNPTKLKHKSIYSVLQAFEKFKEVKFTPLGLRYLKEAEPYLDQADSLNIRNAKRNTGIIFRLRRFFFAMQYSGIRLYFEKRPGLTSIAWNARSDIRYLFQVAARDGGAKTLYLELAPFPNAIAVDPRGINYLNSVPRESSFYRQNGNTSDDWIYLRKFMAQRAATTVKSNETEILNRPYIFVALQTEGDSQLVDFGGEYRNVESFLKDICEASELAIGKRQILVKEHPGKKVSLAHLAADHDNVFIVNDLDTVDLINGAELVVTVNSGVGLESLILGKPVAAAGLAYWDIKDLCFSAKNLDQMKKLFMRKEYAFDIELRNAFINYLEKNYFVLLNWQANGHCRIPGSEVEKIRSWVSDDLLD